MTKNHYRSNLKMMTPDTCIKFIIIGINEQDD